MLRLKRQIKEILRKDTGLMDEVAALTGFKPDTVRRKCYKYDEANPTFLTQGNVLDLLAKTWGFSVDSLTVNT